MKITCYVKLLGLFLILMFSLWSAQAALVNNLYQGEVQVTGQTPADWQKAVPLALKQVLIKLTGNKQVEQSEVITKALTKAQNYVQSYNYLTNPSADPTVPATQSVQIRFSQKAVNRILAQANLTALPNNRDAVLVWLLIPDENNQPKFLADPSNDLVYSFQKQAEARALPLIWPKLDTQDMSNLSAAQAWALDTAKIKLAADRYHPEKILVAKLQKAGTGWQANWLYMDMTHSKAAQTQPASIGQIAAAGFDFMDQQAAALATSPAPAAVATAATNTLSTPAASSDSSATQPMPSTLITLKVDGVYGLDDYAALLNYLRNLSSVAAVDTEEMNDDNIVLSIHVNGTTDMLAKDIVAGGKLRSNKESVDQEVWDYHWLGTEPSSQAAPVEGSQTTATPVTPAPPASSAVAVPTSPSVQPAPNAAPIYTTPPTPAESYPVTEQPPSFQSDSSNGQAQ